MILLPTSCNGAPHLQSRGSQGRSNQPLPTLNRSGPNGRRGANGVWPTWKVPCLGGTGGVDQTPLSLDWPRLSAQSSGRDVAGAHRAGGRQPQRPRQGKDAGGHSCRTALCPDAAGPRAQGDHQPALKRRNRR